MKKLLFLRLKYCGNLLSYCSYLPSFQGKFNAINIPMVIYHHSTVITKVMVLYNAERQYDHGIAINYCGIKFYNIGPWWQHICFLSKNQYYKRRVDTMRSGF
jgi:hypothetical protein